MRCRSGVITVWVTEASCGWDCRNPAILTGGGRSSMFYSDEQDTAKVAKVILRDPSNVAWLSHSLPSGRLIRASLTGQERLVAAEGSWGIYRRACVPIG